MPSYIENILLGKLPKELEEISGIQFTIRHIEILCCLLQNKDNKVIANLLSVSEHTIAAHCNHMRQRANKISRQHLIEFGRNSGKALALNDYYLALKQKIHFERILKLIKESPFPKKEVLLWYSSKITPTEEQILKLTVKHLNYCGIKVQLTQKLALLLFQKAKIIVTCFSKDYLHSLEDKELKNILEKLERKKTGNRNVMISLLLNETNEVDCLEELKKKNWVKFNSLKAYYESFFALLAPLIPLSEDLENQIKEFKKNGTILETEGAGKVNSQLFNLKNRQGIQLSQIRSNFISLLRFPLFGGLSIAAFCMLSVIMFLKIFYPFSSEKAFEEKAKPQFTSIRSDLPLPHDNILLKRSELMKNIDDKLKGEQDIQAIALIGVGGVGKTTIARSYAHKQEVGVVWEINAETKSSLIESFESLAYALAKTGEEKKILRGLEELKSFEERIEKTLSFIKERLKTYPSWLLIYDNVERFSDIQKYFPTDSKTWGKGKILVTSRNSNLADNNYIQHILPIEELKEEEKLKLFKYVMNHKKGSALTPSEKEQAQKFLIHLPPFPLDISLAAYYLKATNISYEQYLRHFKESEKDFEQIQLKLLNDTTPYTQTRYKIIVLAIEKIIQANKDFGDLLLFISLLDSQDIPLTLLKEYKTDIAVEDFIYHLRKYSLINQSFTKEHREFPSFSMHRSTQEIILKYLIRESKMSNDKKIVNKIFNKIEEFMVSMFDQENSSYMNILTRHGEKLLINIQMLDLKISNSIKGCLGSIYLYLGNYKRAEKLLEENLKELNNYDIKNFYKISWLLNNLGRLYITLADHEKAKKLIEESRYMYKKYFPYERKYMISNLKNLAFVFFQTQELIKLKNLFEESIQLYRSYLLKNPPDHAILLTYLGETYRLLGDYIKSEILLEEAILISKKYLPSHHKKIGEIKLYLGALYKEIGYYKRAIIQHQDSVSVFTEIFPERHGMIAWASIYLACAYRDSGQLEKAKDLLIQSLLIYEKHYNNLCIPVGWVLLELAVTYKDLGNFKEAKKLLYQCFFIFEKNPTNLSMMAKLLLCRGAISLLEGDLKKSEQDFKSCLEKLQQCSLSESYKCLELLSELYIKKSLLAENEGDKQASQKFKSQALDHLTQALKIVKTYFPEDSPHIERLQTKLNDKFLYMS